MSHWTRLSSGRGFGSMGGRKSWPGLLERKISVRPNGSQKCALEAPYHFFFPGKTGFEPLIFVTETDIKVE